MEFIPLIIVLITIAAVDIAVRAMKVVDTFELEQELAIALDTISKKEENIILLVKNVQHTNREYTRMKDQRDDADSENARLQDLLYEEKRKYADIAGKF